MRCAVVNTANNTVINVIMASPKDLAPDGCVLVELNVKVRADIGNIRKGKSFDLSAEQKVRKAAGEIADQKHIAEILDRMSKEKLTDEPIPQPSR